jgi:formiminotetrahydrofolate cyclodeaminase
VADRYVDLTVQRFLDQVAAREPAPGGGSVAAITLALAAGLVAMAARFSDRQLPDAAQVADEADRLRSEASALADADAAAYADVLASGRSPRAVLRATQIPLEVCEGGVVVASHAARVARDGNPNLRGDAGTALLLAAAAVRSAAHLISLNASGSDDLDEYLRRSEDDVRQVSAAVDQAGLAASG